MFRHILLPTDGSRLSRRIVRPAIALAKHHGARLTAMHVIPAEFGRVLDAETKKRLRRASVEEGKEYLARIESAARARGVECQRLLLAHDQPWRAITGAARRRRCDLIVMAAHGRHGLAALVLGSQTNRVLVHSKIPVLVYR